MMSKLLNDTTLIHDKISSVFEVLIIIPYSAGIPVALVNFFILASLSSHWKQMRNKAENINDANYKKATVNYVKFALTSLALLMEILLVLTLALSQVIEHVPYHIFEYYSLQFKEGSTYIDGILNTLTIAGTMLPLFVVNMLTNFFIQVIAESNVDFGVLHREGWISFWVCIIVVAFCTFGNEAVRQIGTFMTGAINISLCFIFYKRTKKLYITLKSKCLDYMYEPKKLEFFRSQAANYKWSSLVAGISLGGFMISDAVLTMYESMFKLIIYGLKISHMEPAQFDTYYEIIHYTIQIIEEIMLINWSFVSTLLNYLLLILFLRKAILHRRFMSKPIHYKMMQEENGRIVYKRVSY